MGLVVKRIGYGECNFPAPGNSHFQIEDNVGDEFPIHIHFGQKTPKKWLVRLHFTYEDYVKFADSILAAGRL